MVTAQPQNPLQAQSTRPVLLAGHMPHGFKPKAQGFVRVVEQCPRSRRNLVSTFDAPELSSLHRPGFDRMAAWANKSLRPSQLRNIVAAHLLGRERFTKFHDCLRIAFHGPNLKKNSTSVNCIALYLNLPQFTSIYLNLPQFTSIYLNLPQFGSIRLGWTGSPLGRRWLGC